jgi:hypothetical protein
MSGSVCAGWYISASAVTKVAALKTFEPERGVYILIGTGLLLVWILLRRQKR